MTAINVIRQSAVVNIVTDGAMYRPDGTLESRTQKIFPLAHLNAIIAGRGNPLFASSVGLLASIEASSFDHLKMLAISLANRTFSDIEKFLIASSAGSQFDLVIAGWSKVTGPDSYFICNHEHHGPAVKPWQIVELGPISLLPRSEGIDAELGKIFPEGVHPDDFDPVADGLRILEIQRAQPIEHHADGFGTQPGVGAFAQLTTITPDVITTRILHRWPDALGRPLAARMND